MSEPNQVLWRGIRPTNPPEYIPVLPYNPNATIYTKSTHIDDTTLDLLTVPSLNTYHIINLFGNVFPYHNGKGSISRIDCNGNTKEVFGYYFADDYKVGCPSITLLSPITLLENEIIRLYSNAYEFYVFCSIEYIKE